MLIDTFSMTATLFKSCRPPVALIIGGSEGGMKRALACSYDVTTGTLYRETVLRLPSQTVDKMHTLQRIRLGLKNPYKPSDVVQVVVPVQHQTQPTVQHQTQPVQPWTAVRPTTQPQPGEFEMRRHGDYGKNATVSTAAEFNQASRAQAN
jgi:hypothetical protein